jgi:hypothetical protein
LLGLFAAGAVGSVVSDAAKGDCVTVSSAMAGGVGGVVGAGALKALGAAAGALAKSAATKTALHHVFPQDFAPEFEQIFKGSGESIHDYTLEIPQDLHSDVHAAGWNADWNDLLHSGESLPSLQEAKDFATQMIHEYGLQGYGPFVRYR